MDNVRHEDLRDLLRRIGASHRLVDEVRRAGIDGAALRELTEDEARGCLRVDEHAVKQLMRVRERLGRDPEWVDACEIEDEQAAAGFAEFYRSVGEIEKAGSVKKILASYSDDPKLLLQLVGNKYPTHTRNLQFLHTWISFKQQQFAAMSKLTRSLRTLLSPMDPTIDAASLIASYSDAPWLLADFLAHKYNIPSDELLFITAWGDQVMRSEHRSVMAAMSFSPNSPRPSPPPGEAPDWAIKYSTPTGHSSEVHRLRALLASCTIEMKRQKAGYRELHLKYIQQQGGMARLEKENMAYNVIIHELEMRVGRLEEALVDRDKLILKLANNTEVFELRRKLAAAHDAINNSLGLQDGGCYRRA